ncbi:MAG: TonB-dependent siderophore receptor [Phenylobacterium sp.]|nr:TonB-dependent siderophore receptor [Phenylobacterium sp.]
MKRLALSLLLTGAALAGAARADETPALRPGDTTYGQHLLNGLKAERKDLIGLEIQGVKPGDKAPTVLASTLRPAGAPADLAPGAASVSRSGGRAAVGLPLFDASRRKVGTLKVVLPAAAADKDAALQARAAAIRDRLARRISNVPNLMEPDSFDHKTASNTYMQHLIDVEFERHPELVLAVAHVNSPDGKSNVILGSTIGRWGKAGDADDKRVYETGRTNLEVNATGDRIEIEEELKNAAGETIGALGLVFPYRQDQDVTPYQKAAIDIQEEISRRLLSAKNAFDPYPYDPAYSDHTLAQALVDKTLKANPALRVLAMHVTRPGVARPGPKDNVILASNIGRIGKLADEDDLAIIETRKDKPEINETGAMFEVAMVLHDAAGHDIGVLGTVYRYREGDDKAARIAQSHRIRDALAKQIPSAAALFKAP